MFNFNFLFKIGGALLGATGLSKGLFLVLTVVGSTCLGYIGYLHYSISNLKNMNKDLTIQYYAALEDKRTLELKYLELEVNRNQWIEATELERKNRIELTNSIKLANDRLVEINKKYIAAKTKIEEYNRLSYQEKYKNNVFMKNLETQREQLRQGDCKTMLQIAQQISKLTLEDITGAKKNVKILSYNNHDADLNRMHKRTSPST